MKLKWIIIAFVAALFLDFVEDFREPYCLEVECKVVTEDINNDPFKAVLLQDEKRIDSVVIANVPVFKFFLKRSEVYNIVISKNGYVPRRILLDTHIQDSIYHDELYKLKFDVDLIDLELVEGISIGYFDEPIVFKFNNQTRWFSKPNNPALGNSYGFEMGIENVFQCKSQKQ